MRVWRAPSRHAPGRRGLDRDPLGRPLSGAHRGADRRSSHFELVLRHVHAESSLVALLRRELCLELGVLEIVRREAPRPGERADARELVVGVLPRRLRSIVREPGALERGLGRPSTLFELRALPRVEEHRR